jgi:hypothetical protein
MAAILTVRVAEEVIGAKQLAEGAIGLMQACRSTTAFALSLALGVVAFILLAGGRLPLLRRLPSDKIRGFGGLAALVAVGLAVVGLTRQSARPKPIASLLGPRPNRTVFPPPIGAVSKGGHHHVSVTHHRHVGTRPTVETEHPVTLVAYRVPVSTAVSPVATATGCGCQNYTPMKAYESAPPEEPSREPTESSESESQESHDETSEESTSSSEISSHSYSSSPDGTAEANVDVSINASTETAVDVSTSATS